MASVYVASELLGYLDLDPFASETDDPFLILKVDLIHRLIEERNTNLDETDRGVGITDRLGGIMDAQGIHALERDIEIDFEKAEGVQSVAAKITQGDARGKYKIDIVVTAYGEYLGLGFTYDSSGLRSTDLNWDPPAPVVPPAIPPVLTSLSFDLADVVGGDLIQINGLGLDGVTACEVGNGLTWSSVALLSVTPTVVAITMPALTAGSYFLRLHNAGGPSNTLAIEAWAPTTDASCKLLFDAEHTPYSQMTGTWAPRFSASPASPTDILESSAFGLTHHAAVDGAPVFDGNGLAEAGFKMPDNAWTAHYMGADTSGHRAGSLFVIADFTNNDSVPATDATADPIYDDPSIVYQPSMFALCTGRRSTDNQPIIRGWIYNVPDGYRGTQVEATQGVPHSIVTRWGLGAGTMDLSVDGALAGASYAQRALTQGVDSSYSAHVLRLGITYPYTAAAQQRYAGRVRAWGVCNAKVSDTFITKLHKWARVHLGLP